MTSPPTGWTALRVLREKDGHSQASLAEASGLTASYISMLEAGIRTPNAKVIDKLARALNVPKSMLEPRRVQA